MVAALQSDDPEDAGGRTTAVAPDDLTVGDEDVTIGFSPEAWAVVLRLAALRGMTAEEVLSDALALQEAVTQARASGARVLVEKRGHVEELVDNAKPAGRKR